MDMYHLITYLKMQMHLPTVVMLTYLINCSDFAYCDDEILSFILVERSVSFKYIFPLLFNDTWDLLSVLAIYYACRAWEGFKNSRDIVL